MSTPSPSPSFPEPTLFVHAWNDPVLDQLGHDPRSAYVERFWIPILGPSSYLIHRRLVATLERDNEGAAITSTEWATDLGLGVRGGKHGPFWRSLDRLARFGALHRSGPNLTVRRRLAPLNQRQVAKLAPHLQLEHKAWETEQLAKNRRSTVARYQPHHAAPVPAPSLVRAAVVENSGNGAKQDAKVDDK